MNNVARMEAGQRAELFSETASRLGLADVIVEKDFWVCWALKQIFSIDPFREMLLFKGGTSLSKVFGAIKRFSEDIDLAVDYAVLGFAGERDPRQEGISRTKQAKILDEMLAACTAYIRADFLTTLRARFSELLGDNRWDLSIDDDDPHVVRFQYPNSVRSTLSYITPQVVLELGTHAEFVPRDSFLIRSFAASEFPKVFQEPEVRVTTLLAKRTFWEKVTILHAEYYRDAGKAIPSRYSRHYYDVALLSKGSIKSEALADRELLAQVVRHKATFYPAAWARYDLAVPATMRLTPPERRLAELKQDYKAMEVMIFGQTPTFDSILGDLAALEAEIGQV